MGKELSKELLYLVFAITLGLVISYALGANPFSIDSTIDINIGDTYYIIESFLIWILLVVFTIFIIYSIRRIRKKNKIGLTILITSGISSILLLTKINGILSIMGNPVIESFAAVSSSETQTQQEMFSFWKLASNVTLMSQFIVLMLLLFCIYRTSKTHKL